MTIKRYIVNGTTVRQDARGISVTESGLLTDISGPAERRSRAAIEASGLPRYGARHTAWPALRLADIILTALDSRQWSVSLVYREPLLAERLQMAAVGTVVDVEWFSANVTVSRLYDAAGNRMFHWYAGKPTTLVVTEGRVIERRTTTTQLGVKAERADVQIASIGARVTMVESVDPRSRLGFIGRINSDHWSGAAPGTWLFVGPSSGRREQGRWSNGYELLYRQDTWALESVIEFNGAPPSDATLGNGIQRFQVYGSKNFSNLGFSL